MKEKAAKQPELIPRERFIKGDSPAKIPNWRLIDSPTRPDCVESEEGIEIYTTKNNVKYVRTPDDIGIELANKIISFIKTNPM